MEHEMRSQTSAAASSSNAFPTYTEPSALPNGINSLTASMHWYDLNVFATVEFQVYNSTNFYLIKFDNLELGFVTPSKTFEKANCKSVIRLLV